MKTIDINGYCSSALKTMNYIMQIRILTGILNGLESTYNQLTNAQRPF